MLKSQSTELTHYFAIKSDLLAAAREGRTSDVEFHTNELAVIRLHTDSDRLRAACAATIAAYQPAAAVSIA